MTDTKQLDLLAIGDIVTDAFIKLKEAEVHCNVDNEKCELCMKFGDKIPYDSVEVIRAVGNSANASVSASRLGISSGLLSYIGPDQNGEECVEELQKNNVDISLVRTEIGKSTNYHYVLWYDVDRTILIKHETFTYSLGQIDPPKWIYLSSLNENSLPYQMQIAEFLDKNPETKLAFQPGTFQIRLDTDELQKIYQKTDIFFCNVEEAQIILKNESRDLPTLLKAMHELGPRIVVITDGINGAYAYDPANNDMFFQPIYPGKPPFERTGAGDAFASTVVSALILGKSLREAMTWGPINSMSVTYYVGAQKGLLSRDAVEKYIADAPEEYKLRKIE